MNKAAADVLTDLLAAPLPTVKPRIRQTKRLPVVAIDGPTTLDESGEMGDTTELVRMLRHREPTLFAMVGAADFVSRLNQNFLLRYPNEWQWRVSTHERDIVRPDGVKVAARVSVVVHYFGFKNGNYHKIIDPVTVYGQKLDRVWPGDETQLTKLVKWAVSLRDFCDGNGIDVKPTAGAMGAQFLTDKRFYPNARRKVPATINERVREQLPGNYYLLNVQPRPEQNFIAHYLDQHRAHHYHARTTSLPASDQLYAHGRFTDLAECVFDDVWPGFHGLYCLDLKPPRFQGYFHWHSRRGPTEKQFVFSNELPHLLDTGYTVTGVRAAWGSPRRDTGLSRYAQWAGDQLDWHDEAPWLKPILLSTYGILATRPRHAEAVFRLASKGEAVTVRTGHGKLNGRHTQGQQKLEPRIANVLHRGMIEAATRSESVGFAEHLNALGYTVLSIYADAVIVKTDDDKGPPALIEPWRCKETLNHLRFINQQAFISGEMTKLPGVSRELLKYSHSPGHAPRRKQYDALTGEQIESDRRI